MRAFKVAIIGIPFMLAACADKYDPSDERPSDSRTPLREKKAEGKAMLRVPQPPSAELMAAVIRFPGKLASVDRKPTDVSEIFGATPLWMCSFTSSDKTFVRTTVGLFDGGSFSTAERRRQIEEQIVETKNAAADLSKQGDQGIKDALSTNVVREFELPGGRKGYGSVFGFGPGGEGHVAYCSSRDGRYDLVVEMSRSFADSDRLGQNDQVEQYLEVIRKQPLVVLENVIRALDDRVLSKN